MKRTNLNDGWRFRLGLPGSFEEESWREIILPHDFMLELDTKPDAPAGPASGFYPGAAGTYERTLHIPAECLKLVSAIIVAIAIASPYIKRQIAFQKKKRAAIAAEKGGRV